MSSSARLGEFERIARIRRILARGRADVLVGIGDDAAVLAPSSAAQVLTVDVGVEGVHFRPEFADWSVLGRRSFMAAASDLAGMGAEPRVALLSLIVPGSFADDDLFALVEGVARGADEIGLEVVGGNLSAGERLSVTTTVVGAAHGPLLLRSGAREGDSVFVTGRPGERGLGLALLLAGDASPDGAPFVEAWRRPTARIDEGRRLVGRASACVDVSDGLSQDLGHVAAASGVAVVIEAGALPVGTRLASVAARLGRDPLDFVLFGGEEYELAFTATASAPPLAASTRIGRVEAGRGVFLEHTDGTRQELRGGGFDHFGSGAP